MPYLTFTQPLSEEGLPLQMVRGKSQIDSIANNEGVSSSSAKFKSNYANLPHYLRSCLDFSGIVCKKYAIDKGKLVRLLLAEGLIQEKPGEIMEDTATKIVMELISLGMLIEVDDGPEVRISASYGELSIVYVEKQIFFANSANSPLHVVIRDDGKKIHPNFKGLLIQSVFVMTAERWGCSPVGSTRGLSRAYVETLCGLQYLLVLELDGKIEYLPDEVGDLVHLRYLGVVNSDLDELPRTLGNLQNLQTLDIRMCRKLHKLPAEILNIHQLRHLLMSNSIGDREMRVPLGIGKLANLHTLSGVYAGDGIASELSTLTQLQVLGVMRVSDDHASELSAAIMKMENLVSLSLEAEMSHSHSEDKWLSLFPELESFSPPPLVEELHLHGLLTEMPNWLASMENLTRIYLSFSYLSENPTSVPQILPKLKHLTLWEAYKAKQIGQEFCEVGGFSKLETLVIASNFLVEWTEIVNGAFPNLRYLSFRNCLKLRFLPEGLQNISTLQELCLLPLPGELARQLQDEESYKIKNISKICILRHPLL